MGVKSIRYYIENANPNAKMYPKPVTIFTKPNLQPPGRIAMNPQSQPRKLEISPQLKEAAAKLREIYKNKGDFVKPKIDAASIAKPQPIANPQNT